MIRKKLRTLPAIDLTQVGTWWEVELTFKHQLTQAIAARDVVHFDPSLAVAGVDGDEIIYSRTDQPRSTNWGAKGDQLQGIQIVAERPKEYVVSYRHKCIVARPDARVCLVAPSNRTCDMFLAYHPGDLPTQLRPTPNTHCSIVAEDEDRLFLWLQSHPHLYLEWNIAQDDGKNNFLSNNRQCVWSQTNTFTKPEWKRLGYLPITNQQKEKYSRKEVAKFQAEGYRWQLTVPSPTIEEAEAEYGLKTNKVESTNHQAITSSQFTIVDRAKAAKLFPYVAAVPQAKKIGHKYSGYGFNISPENLAVLSKAFIGDTLSTGDGYLYLETGIELDPAKIVGWLQYQSGGTHPAFYTSVAEFTRLFIRVEEAERLHQIAGTPQKVHITTDKCTEGVCYHRKDIAKYPLRDHKKEKKSRESRRKDLLKAYPHLPRKWYEHADSAVSLWQDIHQRCAAGELQECTDIPVFRGLTYQDNRKFTIKDWINKNDPQSRYDGIEHKTYCPPYTNLDELASLPNYAELVQYLFDDKLIHQLLLSKKAQAALIAEMI